jgi:methylated-DNA-protein-cysteine methyltransferase related protein
VPRGRVASYGLVAERAGSPRSARQVGLVLRLGRGLPWWRIVAKDGRIVIQNPEMRLVQVAKLQEEGIRVVEGAVDYERHAWKPRAAKGRR